MIHRHTLEDAAIAALPRPPVYAPAEPNAILALAPRRAAAATAAQDLVLPNTRPGEFVQHADGTHPIVQLGERTEIVGDDLTIHPIPADGISFITTRATSAALTRLQLEYSHSVQTETVSNKTHIKSFTFLVLDKAAYVVNQALTRL